MPACRGGYYSNWYGTAVHWFMAPRRPRETAVAKSIGQLSGTMSLVVPTYPRDPPRVTRGVTTVKSASPSEAGLAPREPVKHHG